jgi:very-short-patch-repair endonuclease
VFRQAYRIAGAPVTWHSQLAAVVASVDARFAFSHRTAGALLGLDPIKEGDLELISKTMPRLPGVTVHRIRGPWPQVIHAEGFPVTSTHRTLLDLFAVKHPNMAELALEDALRKKMTTLGRLWEEYSRTCTRGRNGCRHYRRALLQRDHRDGTLQSRMEAKLRRIIKGLPGSQAIPQHEVRLDARHYFLDFAYPDVKIGIEAQSIKWHLGEAKFCYDLKRDRRLKRVGWTMLYYSMDDLLRPDEVREEILAIRDSAQRAI